LWRTGITRCDESCDLNDADSTCKCAIPDEYFEKYTASELIEKALLTSTVGK
jgi:hypothetical protein